MHGKNQFRNLLFRAISCAATTALAIAFLLIVVATQPAHAQTFKLLHTFTGGQDGGFPEAGVAMDKAGNLYGTAVEGGNSSCYSSFGCGTVYKLTHQGSGWIFNLLYTFNGDNDGVYPRARVIFGPNSTLYGTTEEGGNPSCNAPYGCGTVFNLRPSPTACKTALCPWTETVLYRFAGGADGAFPAWGDLIFDQAGDIYGTTPAGGNGLGFVYELIPQGSGWTESGLYAFSGNDGAQPANGVLLDSAGNLYGTTSEGGLSNYGTVFQLTYSVGTGWRENLLYSFQNGNDGSYPNAGLIFDPSGNLYGAASNGGTGGGGTVFKLTPFGGSWTYSLVYSFAGPAGGICGPHGNLVMDGAGNLYGTTYCDGANNAGGSVFKLTPSGGSWTYTSLHDFTGGSDGGNPLCNVVFDASGNLYGTTLFGGSQGVGVVWEITDVP